MSRTDWEYIIAAKPDRRPSARKWYVMGRNLEFQPEVWTVLVDDATEHEARQYLLNMTVPA